MISLRSASRPNCFSTCPDCEDGAVPPDSCPCVSKEDTGQTGHPEYLRLLDELRDLHLEKSAGYGTIGDPLANFRAVSEHSGEPAYVYPVRRAVEKLSRWASLYAQGRFEELGEEHLDVASLLLCAEALRRASGRSR